MHSLIVNLSGLNHGGGSVVADELISTYLPTLHRYKIIIIGNKRIKSQIPLKRNVKIILIPRPMGVISDQLLISAYLLYRHLRGKCDVLLNMSDIPIICKGEQIFFLDWAYAVSSRKQWGKISLFTLFTRLLKKRIFWLLTPFINKYIVQTEHMKTLLEKKINSSLVSVNPLGISGLSLHKTPLSLGLLQQKSWQQQDQFARLLQILCNSGNKLFASQLGASRETQSFSNYILCPNSYNSHKGFEDIVELHASGYPLRKNLALLLLLDPPEASRLFKVQHKDLLMHNLLCVGRLPRKSLIQMYSIATVVVNPSRLESFGFAYYEAALLGVRQVCPALPHVPDFARSYSYLQLSASSLEESISKAIQDCEGKLRFGIQKFFDRHIEMLQEESVSSFGRQLL